MRNKKVLNTVIQGNCIDVLKSLPKNSVDLIFADPPYFLQLENELWRPNQSKVKTVDDKWDKFKDYQEYDQFTLDWLTAAQKVLKETGTIWVIGTYHNIYRVGSIMQDLGYWFLNDVVWIKNNPMPNFRGVRFTNAHETLIWAKKNKEAKYTFNHHDVKALNENLQMRSDWSFWALSLANGKERIKSKSNGLRSHSTQKPESLLYRVILSSSKVGDVILDPFFGTGTTGAVAKKLGRNWIGIEKNKNYIRIAKKRIANIKPIDTNYLKIEKLKEPRIPFGTLIECGLLESGDKLLLGKKPKFAAEILTNGNLIYRKKIGSIHQIATFIKKAPSNGWDHWYYLDKQKSELRLIDELRNKIRQKIKKYPEEK
ncbi:MAG: site-specific DNA-methyltransferase [Anaerolineales bacterium]|nr:site-specific DNA-methyltransferase [Anaerolineales bacterium]